MLQQIRVPYYIQKQRVMAKIISLLLLLISFTGLGQGIEFSELTWKEALAKAKSENKLIFVDAYAKWCGPCKTMAAQTFTQKAAGDFFNANFINLKIDMEEPDGRAFGNDFPVRAYPTLFFIDGNGKLVQRAVGMQRIDGLLALANEALAKGDNIAEMTTIYEKGDRSYEFMTKYVKALNRSGASSLKVSNSYLASEPTLSPEQKAMFLFEAATDADSKLFETMIKEKATIIAKVGEEAYNNKVKKACLATTDKAIEFELKMLLDEAVKKAEIGLTKEQDDFISQAQMSYFKAFNESDNYITAVENYLKAIGKSDDVKVRSTITEMCGAFPKDVTVIEKANKIAKDLYKHQESLDNLAMYCNTLVLAGNKKEALKEAQKAEKNSDKFGPEDKKSLEMLIESLEKGI